MAEEVQKINGAPQQFKDDRGGGTVSPYPVVAIVKSNADQARSGTIKVYVPTFGSPDTEGGLLEVKYMSPFIGLVNPSSSSTGNGEFVGNPQSYGFWAACPDVGTQVICIFINGNRNDGYYIGCVPPNQQHYMVPAVGAVAGVIPNGGEATTFAGADRLPVSELNVKNPSNDKSPSPYNEPKTVHSYAATVFNQQGLIRDPIRGPISSSSQRETPSRVFGFSTKGTEIFDGGYSPSTVKQALKTAPASKFKVLGRTGGHSIVLDDGTIDGRDQLVRIRTSRGHQITMSDDGQTLFITHANGQSYVELGAEGTVDVYAMNSINLRTEGDLNLHADRNINFHAKKGINMKSDEGIGIESVQGTSLLTGTDLIVQAKGKYTHKVGGAMSLMSGGSGDFVAGGVTNIKGSKVNLNSGGPSTTPEAVNPLSINKHTDTAFSTSKGWLPKPAALDSIASRVPAHMPWEMAGKGVDVKVDKTAVAPTPTPATQAATQAAPTQPSKAAPPEASSTVTGPTSPPPPATPAAKQALPPQTMAAVISQQASAAASGTTAAIQSVGKAGASLNQLTDAGILKPGAEKIIGAAMQIGVPFEQAAKQNLFTGLGGISDAKQMLNNVSAGVNAVAMSLDKTAQSLKQAGIITGKELPTQVAGVISAASQFGVNNFTDVVNGAKSATASLQQAISGGNFAANLGDKLKSGLQGLGASLSGLKDEALATAKMNLDISASAFAAIENSLTPLKAGVVNVLGAGLKIPQSTSAVSMAAQEYDQAKAAAEEARDRIFKYRVSYSNTQDPEDYAEWKKAESDYAAANKKASQASIAFLTGGSTSASTAAGSTNTIPSLSIQNVTAAAKSVASGAEQVATSFNSGINALPGGLNAIAGSVNNIAATASTLGTKINETLASVVGPASASTAAKNITAAASQVTTAAGTLTGAVNGLNNAAGVVTEGVNKLKTLSGTIDSISVQAKATADALTAKLGSIPSPTGLAKAAAGELAALQSQLAALGNSPGQVKLPAVATATVDRGAITAQLGATLGNAKIPTPQYTPPMPPTAEPDEALTAKVAAAKKVQDIENEIRQLDFAEKNILPGALGAFGNNTFITGKIQQGQVAKRKELEEQLAAARAEYAKTLEQA